MVPGPAEYTDGPNGQPYRILVSSDTARKMDPSFEGKPVYVEHVNSEQPNEKNKTIEGTFEDDKGNTKTKNADGYVISSFYNEADGMHWCRFIITSQDGMDAIKQDFKLSNCYQPIHMGPGGSYHGIEYSKEFEECEYLHLALVKNPRYTESIILTPSEFKSYNEEKFKELAAVRNSANVPKNVVAVKFSQGVSAMKLNLMDVLFGKKNGKVEKIENANEIGKIEVSLGKNRRVTIAELVRNSANLKEADYAKLMNDEDRPDLANDDEEDKDKEKNDLEDLNKDKKNKKKSNVDEDMDEDKDKKNDESDRPDLTNGDEDEDEKDKENDEADDDKMAKLREKQNKKKNVEVDEKDKENDESDGDDKPFEKKNKKNGDKNTPADEKVDNDDEDMENDDEENPLMNEIDMDGEMMNVGDLINSHVELKNKFATMKQKHNDLKGAYSEMCNKFGQDDAFENDADIPERDEDMQEALGKLENEEKALETSLANRQNSMTKIISRMKNKAEAIAKRDLKKQEGAEHFKKIQNAELESMLNSDKGPAVATETSSSMVERGKKLYGSK